MNTKHKVALMALTAIIALMITMNVQAQVRIGEDAAPTKGAVLDLSSSSAGYVGGLKLQNVSLANLTDLSSFTEIPADVADLKGTIVYNTNLDSSAGLFPGVYQWDGAKWVIQATSGSGNATDAWLTTGNAGTDLTTNFIGTTDNQPLMFRVNNTYSGRISNTDGGANSFGMDALNNDTGIYNNAFGYKALQSNTAGGSNDAFGDWALNANTTGSSNDAFGDWALNANTTGNSNDAFGVGALNNNTEGSDNSAFGFGALRMNTASGNSAFGSQTLLNNTTGISNNAFGMWALRGNTEGGYNSAFGENSLFSNITGHDNSAFGSDALSLNTTGLYNNAFGSLSLRSNTTGFSNNAFGFNALSDNTEGSAVSAFGDNALKRNTTGEGNSAFGAQALYSNTTGNNNNAFGANALSQNTEGSYNIAIGNFAGTTITTGNGNIAIGNFSQVPDGTADNQISIGNSIYVTGATGEPLAGSVGIGMYPDPTTYKLSVASKIYCVGGVTTTSDIRYKKNITTISAPLDIISQLRGTSYEFRTDEFPQKGFSEGKQLGVIAQEVEKVLPELVTTGTDGYKSVNYDGFIPVLIEGMKAQQTQIELQQQIIEQLDARLKALEAAK